jgi:hypothetical protein
MTSTCPAWNFAADMYMLKLQNIKNTFPHHWKLSKTHTGSRFVLPYIYNYTTKLCRQQAEVIQNHENTNVRNIGKGEPLHRKYKRLKLGDGQTYDRSSDWIAVIAGATNDRERSDVLSLD